MVFIPVVGSVVICGGGNSSSSSSAQFVRVLTILVTFLKESTLFASC